MGKSIDAVSEEIDELLLHKLDLMEEKVRANILMETSLKDGYIELAKAKYIRGKESISILQIPNNEDTVVSLFDLETKVTEENGDTTACFDISLKESNDQVDKLTDPIKWYGVLVPQNLRNSQKSFQQSVYLATKVANIQVELISVLSKLKTLYIKKSELCQPRERAREKERTTLKSKRL